MKMDALDYMLICPGPERSAWRCCEESDEFESGAVVEEYMRNGDYAGLVQHCKREVSRYPLNLHAWEALGEAFVFNGQYQDAIESMGAVHRRYPDIVSFAHLILDALFAMGKAGDDFDWALEPRVRRIGQAVLDDCHEFLMPKRKLFTVSDLTLELQVRGEYLAFPEEDLLKALSGDSRFVVEPGPCPGFEGVRVRRKRDFRAGADRG
jgi:hypothetical protein